MMFKCKIDECVGRSQVWVKCKSNFGASATMLREEGDIQVSARMDAAVFIVYLLQLLKLRSQKWAVDAAAQDHVYARALDVSAWLAWSVTSPEHAMPCHRQVFGGATPQPRELWAASEDRGLDDQLSLGERGALLCLGGCIVLPWRMDRPSYSIMMDARSGLELVWRGTRCKPRRLKLLQYGVVHECGPLDLFLDN